MIGQIELTTKGKALAQIITRQADRAEYTIIARRTSWLLAWYYINGYRRFDVYNPTAGALTASYLDDEGNMEFVSGEMLSAVDRVQGRLAASDLRPKIERVGSSLQMVRDRSITQILMDSAIDEVQLEEVKTQFAHIFTTLGSCGIHAHATSNDADGGLQGGGITLAGDLEVVHPREVFPFPALGMDYTRQSGKIRQRILPLSYLEEKYGKRITANLDDMHWYHIAIGDPIEQNLGDTLGQSGYTFYDEQASAYPKGGGKATSDDTDMMAVVKVVELWLDGPRGTCGRYVICSGEYTIEDRDLRDAYAYCPLGWARFLETGTFHGAGMFDLIFSVVRQAEMMMKSLYNNVRDTDRYGILVMPQGAWNERALLRDVGRGLRVMPYQPDIAGEAFKPFTIQPWNTGDFPGKVAQFAIERQNAINPLQDLLAEKGRVDSASGLQILDEAINRAMTSPTRGVVNAFSQAYRGLANSLISQLREGRAAIPVGELSLDLVGALIDPETNEISFAQDAILRNDIPNIAHLNFTVRQVSPTSPLTRKAELAQLAEMKAKWDGEGDWDGFVLSAIKEGIDIPFWHEEERAAYEMVVKNILVLYGSGDQHSGEVILTPHTARPDIQLRVLSAFMASPRMALASAEIQDEFQRYYDLLVYFSGFVLPQAMPNPDDLALVAPEATGAQSQNPIPLEGVV